MNYKGYLGVAKIDEDAGVIRGHVVNTRDTITFQGETVNEAVAAFRESVDDYLAFCASLGQTPEKPFSGKFLVRVKPEVHRDLTAIAQAQGVSINKLVAKELVRLTHPNQASTAGSKSLRVSGEVKATKLAKLAKAGS